MATPREIYRQMVMKITDADVRLVAAVFEDYIGKDNAVNMRDLSARLGMHERVVRDIISQLVTDYGIPIGASSGKAGRWVISTEEERQEVIADLASRVAETNERIRALRAAKLVAQPPVEPQYEQKPLIEWEMPVRGYRSPWE